ncbi:SPL family radical SAM protein [Vallitalea sp.]|uniref:SPL family radical SAM protein n=1 Tax=Vallitalea sp. TaxID=1882829 RepID=UPI0025F019FE|nr:spore photoproduct lyase [Vallitalea sp.]MCT4686105.1 spore photoproduct lyase [Vallitalea sp.]
MDNFIPAKVLYEETILEYELGKTLYERYKNMNIEMIPIEKHHDVEFIKKAPDEKFVEFKKYLVLGIRKSLQLTPNKLSADFIVPFTSSGCSAMCTYCYLVCNFFKGSYLRIFVNREAMINSVKRKIKQVGERKIYEIGSTSDMVLENTITGNLKWAIEEFGKLDNATCTFATKFAMVDDLLDADHNGNTQMRISVNPDYIIRKVEIGTSKLEDRIDAANKMFNAGYRVGINIAPIILLDNWQVMYRELLESLSKKLDNKLQDQLFFELIFMTYGYANDTINSAALKGVLNVFDRSKMCPKGRGKFCYDLDIREDAARYFKDLITHYFPNATISYIV